MKIEDLDKVFDIERFPALGEKSHPKRDSVLAARSAIAAAVVDDEFLADCISSELRLIEDNQIRHGLVPFFTIPGVGVWLAFGYWPPGGTPGPHEHTAWTITAVCRNELEVLTYDREASYRRRKLVPKNCFQAAAGRVGYIYEPCIHEPRNRSSEWSLSLHVSSPLDGEATVDHTGRLPDLVRFERSRVEDAHPYMSVVVARQRQQIVHQLSRIVASMNVPEAPCLLAECFKLASSPTRRLIQGMLHRPERDYAAQGSWVLARTHKDLVLSRRSAGDLVTLNAGTSNSTVEELVIAKKARDTIAFIINEPIFEVCALPGGLTDDEKIAIAEALEESGLFTRVRQ
jgi:hypothetical protein